MNNKIKCIKQKDTRYNMKIYFRAFRLCTDIFLEINAKSLAQSTENFND